MLAELDSAEFYSGQAKQNYVRFHPKEIRREDGTTFVRDYIVIVSPGQNRSEVDRPVQEKDQREYPDLWKAYKANQVAPQQGTPIEALPGLSDDRKRLYASLNIYSVEQLAAISDNNLNNIGMGAVAQRDLAKAFLKNRVPDEVGAMLKKLQSQLEEQAKEIERLKGRGKAA